MPPSPLDSEQEDVLRRLEGELDWKRRMDIFMQHTINHQYRTARSFSNLGSSLQRQQGQLDDIGKELKDVGKTIAVHETKILHLETENRDQWEAVNGVRFQRPSSEPRQPAVTPALANNGNSRSGFMDFGKGIFKGYSAKEIVYMFAMICLILIVTLLAFQHFNLVGTVQELGKNFMVIKGASATNGCSTSAGGK